ncbi:hypothetical protein H7J73_21565 [Mycolicibacterium komossense]|uniref:Putative regulatory protein FmdB zinc ribbon domain-containing protein n=2 Tax=Mycolicibacterium komossense TaxID=1779 RepID=A0ABT3CGK7_9MYCO|nr:hypothetical protein [Mycolicibacterium komossense]
MPTYPYRCDSCGPFDLTRPMAAVAASEPCPAFGEADGGCSDCLV